MEKIKISVAQFEDKSGDKAYNLSVIDSLSQKAALQGSQAIAFHECALTGYYFARRLSKDQMLDLAEYIPEGDSIKKLVAIAARYGITLAIQNHHDIALHHEAMKWLIEEVNLPNVRAAFDCWSPTLEGLTSEEIKQAIYTMKPYIVHTTTADYKELPRFKYELTHSNYVPAISQMRAVPIGEGFLDYKTFINTLKEIGYQGYIAYEMCEVLEGGGSVENLDRCAKTFIEYIKQFK